MSADAAALAHKVHEWATLELCLAPSAGQRLPSPEDIRKILRGDGDDDDGDDDDDDDDGGGGGGGGGDGGGCHTDAPSHPLPIYTAFPFRSISPGPLSSVFSFLVTNAVAASKARDVRSNIRIAAASRQFSSGSGGGEGSASERLKQGQMMQEIAALRSQLSQVQAESAGFCR